MGEPFHDLSRALLITNAASGANRKLGVAGVRDLAASAGLRHCYIDEINELDAILHEHVHDPPRLMVVNAGDGTVCRILDILRTRELYPEEPVFALLRGGTTNMIHNDVGFRGRPQAALARLFRSLDNGRCELQKRHILRVSQPEIRVTRYGFFLATHAAVRAIRRTRARLHRRVSTGRLSEFLSVSGMVWRLLRRRVERDPVLSPVALELSRDYGQWRQVSQILLMAVSVRRALLGLRPLAHGQRAGLTVLTWPDYRLLPWLRRIVRGRIEELDTISLRGEFEWILDGEIYEHRNTDGVLTVDVDRPVRFLVPGPT